MSNQYCRGKVLSPAAACALCAVSAVVPSPEDGVAGMVSGDGGAGRPGATGPAGIALYAVPGGGIMHEEMPRPGADGRMGGFQLWVNLPAELKMTKPRYQDLSAAQIPEVRRVDGTVIRVVAGEVDGVAGDDADDGAVDAPYLG